MADRMLPNRSELLMNRRHVLSTAVGVAAARVVPSPSEAAQVVDPVQAAVSSKAPPNVSATTARRLMEIEARNNLRRASDLPTLSVPKELRRMKRAEDEQEFSRFAAPLRQAIWDQVFKSRRAAEGTSNWRPSFMEGMAYQNRVDTILRKRFRAEWQRHRVDQAERFSVTAPTAP